MNDTFWRKDDQHDRPFPASRHLCNDSDEVVTPSRRNGVPP